MAHNIQPTHYGNDLEISNRDGGPVAVFGFGHNGIGVSVVTAVAASTRPAGVGTGDVFPIRGEDLFAIRELLNELPEEAFVRPTDPVDKDAAALTMALSEARPGTLAVIPDVEAVYRRGTGVTSWYRVDTGYRVDVDDLVAAKAEVIWSPSDT